MRKLHLLGSASLIALGLTFGSAAMAQEADPDVDLDVISDNGSQQGSTGAQNAGGGAADEGGQVSGTNSASKGGQAGDGGNTAESNNTVASNNTATLTKDDNSDDDFMDVEGDVALGNDTTTVTKTETETEDNDGIDADAEVNIGNKQETETTTVTKTETEDNDGIDADAPVNIGNKDDNSDDDGFDLEGDYAVGNDTKTYTKDDNSDDDGIDADAPVNIGNETETETTTVTKDDNSDDDWVDIETLTVDDNSDDDGLDLDIGDVAISLSELNNTVTGNAFVQNIPSETGVTITTGYIDNTSISNSRGINQVSLNTGVANQTNSVNFSAANVSFSGADAAP